MTDLYARSRTQAEFDAIFRAVTAAGDLAGSLPSPITKALAAVRMAAAAVKTTTATITAPGIQDAAVASLLDDAVAGRAWDTGKAGKSVSVALRADQDAATTAAVVDAGYVATQAWARGVVTQYAHAIEADCLAPIIAAGYDRVRALVAALPHGIDPEKPRSYGSKVAGTLADLQDITERIGTAHAARGALRTQGILDSPIIDKGGKFTFLRNPWTVEDSRLLGFGHVANIANAWIRSALPEPFSADWWIAVVRSPAILWWPTAAEQDAACESYWRDYAAGEVQDAWTGHDGTGKFSDITRPPSRVA